MSKVNVLIVEDESITAAGISSALKKLGYAVSGIAASAMDAIDVLDQGTTDIAILDINIQGDRDGIWVAKKIQTSYDIPYIFLTSYGEQKMVKRAIETLPYGYLLKPFNKPDIYAAIELALNNYSKGQHANAGEKDSLKDPTDGKVIKSSIYVKDNYCHVKILIEEITFLHSEKNYVEINTQGKRWVVRTKLSDLLDSLPELLFAKVHRSYAVNINYIEKIGGGYVQMKGEKVPLAANYKADLLARLNTM